MFGINKKTLVLGITLLTIVLGSTLLVSISKADSNAFPQLIVTPLKYNPEPAESGKYMDLWINVINSGTGETKFTKCVLEPKFPFYLDPNENATRIIGIIPAKNNSILQYTVRVADNAVEGWNELDIKCKYSDLWHEYKLRIYVQSKHAKLSIGQIMSKPDKLLPDTTNNELDIDVVNTGNRNASYVRLILNLPKGITPSNTGSNIAYLGTINAGDSKVAKYYLDINKNVSGWENISAALKYSEISGNRTYNYTKQVEIPIYIHPLPVFTVKLDGDTFESGSSGVLKLSIKNIGKKEAKSVSILVYKDYSQPFDFSSKYAYVGDLNPGETGDAAIKFSIDNNAIPQKYKILLTIRYLYGDQVKTDTESVTIDVKQGKGNVEQKLILYITIGIIILGGLYELVIRRKKGKRRQ